MISLNGIRRHKHIIITFGRAFLAVLFILLIIYRVDFQRVAPFLEYVRLDLLILSYAFSVLTVILMAYRWKIFIKQKNVSVPMLKLLRIYFVGVFFNTFLPGSIGGDVKRALDLSNTVGGRSVSLSIVITERLIGIISLLVMGMLSSFFLFAITDKFDSLLLIQIFVLSLIGFSIMVAFFSKSVAKILSLKLKTILKIRFLKNLDIYEKIKEVYKSVYSYKYSGATLFKGFLISFLMRGVWVFACYLVAVSMGIKPSFSMLILILSIVEIARMVPISIHGVGIREGVFGALYSGFGMSFTEGVLLAFIFYLLLTVNGIVGGVIYAVSNLQSKTQ
ncbi:flippase-like domain-containing protein [Candidatus Marinimicrobia bacterium MT.SAG.4]|nr:flippase-like domain-containing protein [Candidatus Marinimicrobia bacterium MT.SAG.4]